MNKYTVFLFFSVVLMGCQDVIKLDVPDTAQGLVVSGRVTDSLPVTATISLTTGYFEQGQTPRIENVLVWLIEDGDTAAQLKEDTIPGQYTAAYTGKVGSSYHLIVEIRDNPLFHNSTWRSTPEIMNRIFEIDSTKVRYLDRTTTPQAFNAGEHALLYFQEPPGMGDHYRMRVWKNDSLLDQDIITFNDENFDGYYIGQKGGIPAFSYYGPFDENSSDTARVEISSISREYYQFLGLINEQVFRVGSPFDPPPQTIIGNIYNMQDHTDYAYGYFSASAIITAEARQ